MTSDCEGPNDGKLRQDAEVAYANQSERLALYSKDQEDDSTGDMQALRAKFVTPQDPIIITAQGNLPAVPIEEAKKLNRLGQVLHGGKPESEKNVASNGAAGATRISKDGTVHGVCPDGGWEQSEAPDAPLRRAIPRSRTNPLFPPLPLYGPASIMRNIQCHFFQLSSAILSACFLAVIVLGALYTSIRDRARPLVDSSFTAHHKRPFLEDEKRLGIEREKQEREWLKRQHEAGQPTKDAKPLIDEDHFTPLEGGPDQVVCDVRYYARRVGLECEAFDVQTEDGFIIELLHLYDPKERNSTKAEDRRTREPKVYLKEKNDEIRENPRHSGKRRYPVLLIHGLLQSAGALCCTDEKSLAFYLAKSGFDVWLGNNRCGFKPRHTLLHPSDPRMWAWNIRQMAVMDLPAFVSRVLTETGFAKTGLVAHSQGTTQVLVALAKEQRPEIGNRISVFCALAPAAYAGPLIGKMYFKFMRVISPATFRLVFGIHAFIPLMCSMHSLLPGRLYGALGYSVFSFLFNWTDARWDKRLRARSFQFSPVYISAECMRWWLGRECFSRQKCILATREESWIEDIQDGVLDDDDDTQPDGNETEDARNRKYFARGKPSSHARNEFLANATAGKAEPGSVGKETGNDEAGKYAWYDEQCPPMALWVCGADGLVDGRRLIRRFARGREPHVNIVHAEVLPEYEHLDVIWAMDAPDRVFRRIRQILWQTAPDEAKAICERPKDV